ncbi:bacteriocin fulvocin C-related protein [Nonomuraea glycinis]|jgi:hypothetical protein|uniref:bacteriocin fulvocin C-related protein n=1 Tax=Nonomuraea glycinis TaxID=2047744 RepID=UPI003899BCE2
MSHEPHVHWILAFDASCGQCTEIAERVKRLGGHRIDVLPLSSAAVVEWRARALGESAPWAPTLIRVEHEKVRAWTGTPMAIRLAARLGIKGSYSLLNVLVEARKGQEDSQDSRGRRRFLKLAGLSAAAAVIVGRASPAFADPKPSPAQQWVQANRANLPTTYEAFSKHDLAYRRAIFAELPAKTRSNLWVAHVKRYRAAHPHLNEEQRAIVEDTLALFSDHSIFEGKPTPETSARMVPLIERAVNALGAVEAYSLTADLGPSSSLTPKPQEESATAALANCYCHAQSSDNYCSRYGGGYSCWYGGCATSSPGCGGGWIWECNGMCCVNTTQGPLCA